MIQSTSLQWYEQSLPMTFFQHQLNDRLQLMLQQLASHILCDTFASSLPAPHPFLSISCLWHFCAPFDYHANQNSILHHFIIGHNCAALSRVATGTAISAFAVVNSWETKNQSPIYSLPMLGQSVNRWIYFSCNFSDCLAAMDPAMHRPTWEAMARASLIGLTELCIYRKSLRNLMLRLNVESNLLYITILCTAITCCDR